MAISPLQQHLFPQTPSPEGAVFINDRCQLRMEGEQRVLVGAGVPLAHFAVGDRMAEANAMVLLVEQGWAAQNDVARAFGVSTRTVRRQQRRYDEGGLARLARGVGYPRGRPRLPSRDRAVSKLKADGLSNRAIAERLGIDEKSVRKRLRRLGWKPAAPAQLRLAGVAAGADPNLSAPAIAPDEISSQEGGDSADPNVSAFATSTAETEPVAESADFDPADRRLDRFLAHVGLLDDAAPLFRDGRAVPGAGVLLALPSLVESGVFAAARNVWGSIGPAFYGLRTTLLTLLFMALLRIQRPEALKEHAPPELGRLLGLDRAPEVKTLRRKLTRLAKTGGAEDFGRQLAERRVVRRGEQLGFLYVDGHVRVYYGKRRLPKTHVARIHFVAPATTDYWVNDERGGPLLVVTAQANAGLVKMLPGLLGEVRGLVGERRVTVVFDRGGWSPKLFDQLIRQGFDILTYRKGRARRLPRRCFSELRGTFDGREVSYLLCDRGTTLLGGKLRLRQITRLRDDHQTHILTSRRDLPAVELAYRMFERWRQENFFKYLRDEFLIDALVDYRLEADDPDRDVPNPRWAAVDEQLRKARAKIEELQRRAGAAHFAAALLQATPGVQPRRPLPDRPALQRQIWAALQRVLALEHRRALIPRRIPVGKTSDQPIVKLATQRKHLTNLLKMVAYQAESDLLRLLGPHYRRTDDEGRTLIHSALSSAADLELTNTELVVRLAPLSSAHRSRAVTALCHQLNATSTVFPGSRLRLRYALAAQP